MFHLTGFAVMTPVLPFFVAQVIGTVGEKSTSSLEIQPSCGGEDVRDVGCS